MTTDNNSNHNDNNNNDNMTTETVNNNTDNTDNTNQTMNQTMNLTTFETIRGMIMELADCFKSAGIDFKAKAPELRQELGTLFWLLSTNEADPRKGRTFWMDGVNLVEAKDEPVTMAWLNSPAINLKFRIGVNNEGDLVPYINQYYNRHVKSDVAQLMERAKNFSSMRLVRFGLKAISLFSTKAQQAQVRNLLITLDEATEKLAGVKAMIVNKETGELVGHFGARNWVYPAVIDLVEAGKMHITYRKADVNGKLGTFADKTVWEFYGGALADLLPTEAQESQLTDEHIEMFEDC